MTTAEKIAKLKPGRSVVLSSSNGFTVRAERSGNGKTLRIIREWKGGFSVLLAEPF